MPERPPWFKGVIQNESLVTTIRPSKPVLQEVPGITPEAYMEQYRPERVDSPTIDDLVKLIDYAVRLAFLRRQPDGECIPTFLDGLIHGQWTIDSLYNSLWNFAEATDITSNNLRTTYHRYIKDYLVSK